MNSQKLNRQAKLHLTELRVKQGVNLQSTARFERKSKRTAGVKKHETFMHTQLSSRAVIEVHRLIQRKHSCTHSTYWVSEVPKAVHAWYCNPAWAFKLEMVDSVIYEIELLDSVALESFLLKETALLLACDQDVIQPVQLGCTLFI